MIYWASTRSNLRMFNQPVDAERARLLRDNPTVDSAVLADALGLTEASVQRMQRRLGLRIARSWKDQTKSQ